VNLEAVSYRNMIHFYQDGLIAIHNGKQASDIFTIHQRRGLRRKGIIERGKTSGSYHILTPRALAILEIIREDVKKYFIEVKEDWENR